MRFKDVPIRKWNGGITRELYRDQDDFGVRISCAEIDPGETSFSDFAGYERILLVIEGNVRLERESGTVTIDPGQKLHFSGSEKIQSYNTSRVFDFNVIYSPKLYHVIF